MKYKKGEHAHARKEMRATTIARKNLFGEPVTLALVLIIVALLLYIGYNDWSKQQLPPGGDNTVITNQTQPPKQAKVTIELFVMSKCPYGVQAESAVKRVIDKFGGDVNLSLRFIASESGGTFSSLHGDSEVQEDLRQVCIMKYYPDRLVNYLSCIADGYSNIENVWESCASKNQIDASKIKSCSTSNEAMGLLSDNIKRTDELNVQSSPTIYLNGKLYNGAASEGSLTKGICAVIPGSDTCKNLPPEVAVGLTIVNDKNCILCDTSQIVGVLQSRFEMSNLTVTTLDYSSNEGKALLQEFNITGVPAYIFNASIANHGSYGSLSQYLHNMGSSYVLLVQPVKLVNVVESNNTLSLFVMSWCPYGNLAENATRELLSAIPDLKFTGLNFIASESGNGTFTSLHGQGEVEEDLRQVCVVKYYNSKLFDYLVCIGASSTNSASIWEKCATDNGIDAAKIGNCSTSDEGVALLRDNIKLSNSMGIYSSPTFILNNSTIFNSVSAEQMRQVVCSYDPALAGCNKTLSGAANTGQPSAGCG